MSLAHWIYLTGIILLLVAVIRGKNVVPLAIAATFVTALVYSENLATALLSVFNANLTAAGELFQIFLIIALVTAMLGAMRKFGADRLIVLPFQRLMRGGAMAFAVIAVVSYALSLVFWPTPVVALIGAILVPAALRVGLSPFGCAIAVSITGQGMALASDFVMGVAPGRSAQGAHVPAHDIADRVMVISLIAGVVALVVAYLRDVRGKSVAAAPGLALEAFAQSTGDTETQLPQRKAATVAAGGTTPGDGPDGVPDGPAVVPGALAAPADGPGPEGTVAEGVLVRTVGAQEPDVVPTGRQARAVALAVPLVFGILLVYMLLARFTSLVPDMSDGVGAPLVGGTAAMLLLILSYTTDRKNWMDTCCDHFVDGLVFAFKNMGMVIPVAGFIYIGLADYSPQILGLGKGDLAPAFLMDAVTQVQSHIPGGSFFAAFAMLLAGMLIGLDGSGWPGLPFTGSMAQSLGHASGGDVASLAAIAQNGAGFTGGDTLVIWSSLIVVAGITGVPVGRLARRLALPVISGLVVASAFAAAVMV